MLKIQEYIGCFDSMHEAALYLRRNLNIESYSLSLPEGYSIWHFKPTQKADLNNPLVREASCLVLYGDGELIARAWIRPTVVPSNTDIPDDFRVLRAIAEDMPDGDIVVIYNLEGEWLIGTADSLDGDEYFPGVQLPTLTYEHEIKALLSRRFNGRWTKPFENCNPFMCFVFSYVSPYLGKVMPVLSPELYLMSIINTESGSEFSHALLENMANKMDLVRTNWTELVGDQSIGNRLFGMRTLAPGLMVRDLDHKRIFIPNPIYRAVKSAKDAGDRVRPSHMAKILGAVRDKADLTSIAAAYPDYEPMLSLLFMVREEIYNELMILWNTARRHEKDARKFAEIVQHHPLNYMLFMFRDGGIASLRQAVNDMKPIKLTRLAENKWEKEFDQAKRTLKFAGGTSNGNVEEVYQEEGSSQDEGCVPFSHDGD